MAKIYPPIPCPALQDLVSDLYEISMIDIKFGDKQLWAQYDRLTNMINAAREDEEMRNG